MTTPTLEQRLAAAHKTIDALTRRVEDKVSRGESAFAVLEQNIALERIVAEKTRQLVAQQRALEEALSSLKRAHGELVQAQKLESVGRLAAGIAHEINTPVQFVNDSVHFVQGAMRDLEQLLRSYQSAFASMAQSTNHQNVLVEVEQAEALADLPYLLENIPKALARSLE